MNLQNINHELKCTKGNWHYGKQSITVGKWTITTTQSVEKDWNYWSNNQHRLHGPKVTISDRKITFTRKYGRGVQTKSKELNSWAGNFVQNAIADLGLAPKTKLPLKIRLHKAYGAKLIKTVRGYKIYRRTLLGCDFDYVIVAPLGTTYHDDNYKNLFKGLFAKIRASKARINLGEGLVNWAVCKKLGFCDAGIKSFCEDFGFDYKKSYQPREIETAVRKNIDKATPYLAELKFLAKAFNYSI